MVVYGAPGGGGHVSDFSNTVITAVTAHDQVSLDVNLSSSGSMRKSPARDMRLAIVTGKQSAAHSEVDGSFGDLAGFTRRVEALAVYFINSVGVWASAILVLFSI